MIVLDTGSLRVRLARSRADLEAIRALRARIFPADRKARDPLDAACRHVVVEAAGTGALAGAFRVLSLPDAGRIGESYSARYYDLGRLARFPGAVAEIGRFCVSPDAAGPDILRLAWGALTRMMMAERVRLLFGCASFPGADPGAHRAALGHLARRHLAPERWSPDRKARLTVPLRSAESAGVAAPEGVPPLLRSYLGMGGWVSDHAVVDAEMDTLHVFTGVEVARIPAARLRRLRALSAAMREGGVDLCGGRA